MASFFKPVCDIEIRLDGEDARDMVEFKTGGKDRKEKAPLYKDGESVKGSVIVRPKDGKKLEHTGIKVNLIGSIGIPPALGLAYGLEMYYDRGAHYEFLSLLQELAAPGEMRNNQAFDFEFKNVEKQYESYHGINVKLRYLFIEKWTECRYFIRVTVSRRMADVIREKDLWVYSFKPPVESNSSIKMDVGIEDCLHIEFEYSKSK